MMLVGEMPGDREDLSGKPFVGPAGRLLDEIGACLPWLDAEIELIEPEVLVCLGATAAKALLGPRAPIGLDSCADARASKLVGALAFGSRSSADACSSPPSPRR